MRIRYNPEEDILSILFAEPPYNYSEGQDANDSDIMLHFDDEHRLIELEVLRASERMDVEALRTSPHFEAEALQNERALRG